MIILGMFFIVFCFATYQLFGINKTLKNIDQHIGTWDAAITNTTQ